MRFKCGLILVLALTIVLSGLPSTAQAATIRVPQDKPSIQIAIDSAAVGDTILVSPGNYSERLLISKPLHLVGLSRDTTIIDGGGGGTVVWVGADNVEITGFTIENSDFYGWAVHVAGAKGVNITSNTISAGFKAEGVNLSGANDTLVSNNVFTRNLYAVNATDSVSIRILNNRAVLNDTIGVQLLNSNSSLVFGNNFQGGQEGIDLIQSSRNNVTRNLFKDMLYRGVSLTSTPPSPSYPGRRHSLDNILNENTFERNERGVDVENATLNVFYHNDFFLSVFRHVNLIFPTDSQNSWDNSTLGASRPGGNYWDNYTGVDTDSDGIGDTKLPANGVDNYPLTSPFVPVPIFIRAILANPMRGTAPLSVTFTPVVNGTLTPFAYSWDFGDGSGSASGSSVTHIFSRAGSYAVVLRVTDASGTADSARIVVQVSPPPPVSYTFVAVAAAAAVIAVSGLLLWRRRKRLKAQPAVGRS